MKKTNLLIMTLFAFFTYSTSYSQVDVAGVITLIKDDLWPVVHNGIKDINSEKKCKKAKELADSLQSNFQVKLNESVLQVKKESIEKMTQDMRNIEASLKITTITNRLLYDIGALSIFSEPNFVDNMIKYDAVFCKNSVVRKFQNALERLEENIEPLKELRDTDLTDDVHNSGAKKAQISIILDNIQRIVSEYNDCSKLSIGNSDSKKVNDCFEGIKANMIKIETIRTATSALYESASGEYSAYLRNLQKVKESLDRM